ncbi:MAG: ChaN family lipoprotein, partial [Planctomycetota bacterium]
MYKTILLSGALLIGGLCISCNSAPQTGLPTGAQAQAGGDNMTKTNNVPGKQSMGRESPHPDIPQTLLPEHQMTAEQKQKVDKLIASLSALKVTELYGKYVDLNTLETLDYNALLERLKGIQIIYVAEQHTNSAHHKLQEDLLKSLFQKNPKAALAMEFLYRSKQRACDDYISGKITEEEFDKSAQPGFGPWYNEYYINLIRTAKQNNIKLLALNVEKDIKRKMAKDGWDKLSPEEQKLIARDIDTTNEKHKEF